ncbi:purine-nucleoside phosphorylase [candidate division WOR-3 bacterium]|nr:purine-nucleoside phosphorylase [candidate division WOR-3 bacterium]
MKELKKLIDETIGIIRQKTNFKPKIGVILGTGLGRLVNSIKEEVSIPYKGLPHFPIPTVESHTGRLIFGTLSQKPIVAMQGRFHYYEGYSMLEVTFPVRVLKFLGCDILIVSNAAGGVNPLFERGDVMIICDHINLMPENPLRGENDESIGPRFPDMLNAYDKKLIKLTEKVALKQGIAVKKGVYVGFPGPCFETGAEYRMIRRIGADAVGMSTIPEVIVAGHMGMQVLGLSIITDLCFPDVLEPVSHEIVIAAANRAEPKLTSLIEGVVGELKVRSGKLKL